MDKIKKPRLQEIKLKCGITVAIDFANKKKCRCGAEIMFALTKNNKFIPVELVGNAEWDTHFATCPFAKKFKKNEKSA